MTGTGTISARQLRDLLDNSHEFSLIDTRKEESFEEWHIPEAINYPFSLDESLDEEDFNRSTGVNQSDSIITICDIGKSSHRLAVELTEFGYDEVSAVQDGMQAWSRIYEVEAIPTRDPEIDILQLQRRAKGCMGYLVGWGPAKDAAVIDPTRHIDQFIDLAQDTDHEITHVIDTHIHADHISGGRDLAEAVGANYYLGPRASERDLQFDFEPLVSNSVLDVGPLELKTIEVPGHTTESVGILINDEALLSGDTIFVNSVGRTELQFGDGAAEVGARKLHESLHRTVLALPDAISILPGHFSIGDDGMTKEERPGTPIFASIGEVRRNVPLLSMDSATFVDELTSSASAQPPNFEKITEINTGHQPMPDEDMAIELELGPNRCAAG